MLSKNLFIAAVLSSIARASVLPRQYGGYWMSCETSSGATGYGGGLEVDGSSYYINAECPRSGGGLDNFCTSQIRLGDCLVNDGGRIVPQPGYAGLLLVAFQAR